MKHNPTPYAGSKANRIRYAHDPANNMRVISKAMLRLENQMTKLQEERATIQADFAYLTAHEALKQTLPFIMEHEAKPQVVSQLPGYTGPLQEDISSVLLGDTMQQWLTNQGSAARAVYVSQLHDDAKFKHCMSEHRGHVVRIYFEDAATATQFKLAFAGDIKQRWG